MSLYSLQELCDQIALSEPLVAEFIEREWIRPAETPQLRFDEQDFSRVRFILELRRDFSVNDEGIDLILHLLDQFNALSKGS